MKNNTNKYVNYLTGLLKGCNILACVAISIFVMFVVYFFDGFNLLSALIYKGDFVEAVVIITAVIGALLVIASMIKNLEGKHITYADNMLVSGALIFVLALAYFLISKSKLYTLLKVLALVCLLVAILALFFIRAKFFESVEDKTHLKTNATRATYYQNLFKRDWIFILLLSVAVVVLLVYLYVSNIVDGFVDADNTLQMFKMATIGIVSIFAFLFALRIKEKEQNLIDCTVFSLIVGSCALLIIGFMKTGKLRFGSIFLAVVVLIIAIICSIILVKTTFIEDESKYKFKKANIALYFKNLFKNANVVLYAGTALIITAIIAILESTNLIHKFYENQLGGQDPAVVIEAICLIIAVTFTFLLTEMQVHKIHSADKIVFTMALAFGFTLIIVNGVLGVEFMVEGLIALIGFALSVVFIAFRTLFVKEYEELGAGDVETVCEEPETSTCECVCEEVAVTSEEPVKLKKVNVKKSCEIYLRTGDEQLKQNYSQIKNALLSYGLHSRLTKTRENFSKKGITLSKQKEGKPIRIQAKLSVRGKYLKLHLNVNPNSVDLNYFRAQNVEDKMPDQPLLLKVRTKLSLKRALELIDILAVQENFNAKKKYVDVDYASTLSSEGLTYMQKLGYDYMVKDVVLYDDVAYLNDDWAEKIIKTQVVKKPERFIYDEVTLSVIEKNFEDGSKVSLEAMRQKSLVKINANYITIKASQSLSKKLTIEGNVIEPKAIEMIFMAGGEATRLIGE
ncbi:MAG: hypothetical protein IKV61_02220 [Clostridia bacterium]|nr:hypothetical protein [Clostridia bacterium]